MNLLMKLKGARVTAEPVLFFYMLGVFLLFSVFQNLVYQQVCSNKFAGEICSNLFQHHQQLSVVQTEASHWIRISTLCMVIKIQSLSGNAQTDLITEATVYRVCSEIL